MKAQFFLVLCPKKFHCKGQNWRSQIWKPMWKTGQKHKCATNDLRSCLSDTWRGARLVLRKPTEGTRTPRRYTGPSSQLMCRSTRSRQGEARRPTHRLWTPSSKCSCCSCRTFYVRWHFSGDCTTISWTTGKKNQQNIKSEVLLLGGVSRSKIQCSNSKHFSWFLKPAHYMNVEWTTEAFDCGELVTKISQNSNCVNLCWHIYLKIKLIQNHEKDRI